MKILLVDDTYSKAEEICSALQGLGIGSTCIEHATTSQAARQLLRSKVYDLLLIDLHLPDVVGAKPSNEGGLNFFDLICLDTDVMLPADILFITARDELIADAVQKVLARGAQLHRFDPRSNEWRDALVGRVRYVSRQLAFGRSVRTEPVDIAIITALRTPELEAVLRLDYNWQQRRVTREPTTFHHGTFEREGRTVNVVAACAQRKGMPSAAALASKMTTIFAPQYIVMLGICAGVPGKVELGDIVVADPAWDWGAGKRGESEDGSPVFMAAPYQVSLNSVVAGLANERAQDDNLLSEIRRKWQGPAPSKSLSVVVGPMASGASVIADKISAQSISTQNREVVAIEMEAYAVMAAAEYSTEPKPVAIAIKSVCDFADPEKNDDWQAYAAYTSVSFADRLFRDRNFAFR